jgi:putative selenate reductase
MAHLTPYPFGALARRMFRELDRTQAIFDLPARRFVLGSPHRDLAVRFHGQRAATPFGPAAGPNTQLAQNIVLSWLAGGRVIELKTVQIDDTLTIPRPCIDMQTVGYNVEWSQELKLEQSLEEYVKGAMLVQLLVASGRVPLASGMVDTLFDMSVGYDLAGIRSERVQTFIRGMMDATPLVERLRRQLPDELARYRDLPFTNLLSTTLTLSTFHGCPPEEIERIVDFLLRELRLHCVIKLNPTLLGKAELRGLLHDALGYTDLRVPDRAFDRDTTWDQAAGFVDRLGRTAASLGLSLGVKFSNTLIVENHRDFFPASEREMYLSGPPLHVLALHLVRRFRRAFGDRFPISFSAGIERANFPDAVALGLVPITACTDLLKAGGYARPHGYFDELGRRMDEVGAVTVDEFVVRAYTGGAGAPTRDPLAPTPDQVSAAKLRNTEAYVERATRDPRYAARSNRKSPRKIGRRLRLFDCLTCDKCIPVCPNDANFAFAVAPIEIPLIRLRREATAWRAITDGTLAIREQHQIGNFADFCNDCGNCDVFCPEDGGPYVLKPRVFVSRERWAAPPLRDGFWLERLAGQDSVWGRFDGVEYGLEVAGERVAYWGPGFRVTFAESDPAGTVRGEAMADVNLAYFHMMNWLRQGLFSPDAVNYVNTLY